MEMTSGPVHHVAPVYQSDRRLGHPFVPQPYSIPPPSFATSAPAGPIRSQPFNERPDLPKVGQTRCYWALLTTSLHFTVLDPVLRYHLQEQAASIIDCGLLDFVHPDEKESARRDLGNVLAERTLHGSVTRVRFCRLSRVRRLLGLSDKAQPYPPSFPAELIAVDAEYMAVYLVINCVADGVVLCFIHAVVDLAPHADNDEHHKTGWSNWCSTYGFDHEQAQALYRRLYEIGMPIRRDLSDPSLRVLQIFRNLPDRPLVLSWPPDTALFQEGFVSSVAEGLAQLAQYVQLGYHGGSGSNEDARTSCTRRFKSVQTIKLSTSQGVKIVQVESILIPHGTIIFACHKINGAYLDINTYSLPTVDNHQAGRFTNVELAEPGPARTHSQGGQIQSPAQQEINSQYYVREWVDHQSRIQERQQESGMWGDSTVTQPAASNVYFEDNFADDANASALPYSHSNSRGSRAMENSSPTSTTSGDSGTPTPLPADLIPQSSGVGIPCASSLTAPSCIPPETNEVFRTRSHSKEMLHSYPNKDRDQPPKLRTASSSGARAQGNPPTGVLSCARCQTTHSPEWRKGPSGKKDLCNACGLRYARSRAKKEGLVSRKRKNRDNEVPPSSKQSAAIKKSSSSLRSDPSTTPASFVQLQTTRMPVAAANAPVLQQHPPNREATFDAFSQAQSQSHPTAGLGGHNSLSRPFTFVESSHNVQIPYYS